MTQPQRDQNRGAELAARLVAGDRRALAQAVTLIESTCGDHAQDARNLLEHALPHSGRSVRVGISGVPGVGKSTLIDALGTSLVSAGVRVAVLAVDPSSSVSGGCILGDKTRMPRLALSERAFVRPSPSSGALGGVARRTREALLLCEAAGFDIVLIETVGVGQSEFAVAEMVDVFLLLMLAGAGDELQGIKRGILELADVVAITKADGDNRARAELARLQLQQALRLLRGDTSTPEVVAISATEERGIEFVWHLVMQKHERLRNTGALQLRRMSQRKVWFRSALVDAVQERFFQHSQVAREVPELTRAVERSDISPEEAVRRLFAAFDSHSAKR